MFSLYWKCLQVQIEGSFLWAKEDTKQSLVRIRSIQVEVHILVFFLKNILTNLLTLKLVHTWTVYDLLGVS